MERMKVSLRWMAACLFGGVVALAAPLRAQVPDLGRTVVVVFNSEMSASKDIAEHYAERRSVPAGQVFGLALPKSEEITREQYLKQIEQPILERLVKGGHWTFDKEPDASPSRAELGALKEATVRYAVLCYGVPTKIAEDRNLKESARDQVAELLRRNEASVDSQLASLPMESAAWYGPLTNPGYLATNTARLHPTNGILMVTRLDGPNPDVARRLVDLSIQAETQGLWGRAYFDTRGISNGNLAMGDDRIRKSEELVSTFGFSTEMDAEEATWGPGFPMSDVAIYVGWYASHASGPFSQPSIDFVPGAFAYHLHSFSAQILRSTDYNWVGPLIHRGATASIGYVNEPFLTGTADLPAFFGRLLYGRFTYAESAWASLNSLSWQGLVVGDPLYRPGLKMPQQLHAELDQEQSPLLAWSHLLVVNRNQAMKATPTQLIEYLRSQSMTKTNALLTEKLGDLNWEDKHYSDALDYYDMTLERNPSKSERLRMLLKYARLRQFYGPRKKVIAYYREVLADYPDYPARLELYEKLLPLAKEERDTALVEECEEAIRKLKG